MNVYMVIGWLYIGVCVCVCVCVCACVCVYVCVVSKYDCVCD